MVNSRSCPRSKRVLLSLALSAWLSGCATYPDWMPSSGPSREAVQEKGELKGLNGLQLIPVTGEIAHKLAARRKQGLFSDAFGLSTKSGYVVGSGDVLEVSVWEAPPAMLFGTGSSEARASSGPATTRVTAFPEQMVSGDGLINMPFAGHVPVAGSTPQQIEMEITRRLKDKANQPQVLVRVIRNNTANVTVVGEVSSSARVPLTARGERLLDALASAGGVKQPVGKITLQLTRGDQVKAMALDTIIRDPKQNILLQPGDVITALHQPLSFTVLGATTKNEEINFEAQGITLAQALARAGGLQDARADARAVYIFRLEDKKAFNWKTPPNVTPDGKVPVIYEVNLKDPASFFMAQGFPVDNKDVLYVANAPAAELQKFLNMVASSVFILRTVVPVVP